MAEKPDPQVKSLAKSIFIETSALIGGRGTSQIAIQAFKAAKEYLEVEKMFDSGELDAEVVKQWGADCFAPKLPPTHPLNLVSAELNKASNDRNKERVNRISKWLVNNPDPDAAYKEADWEWSKDTTRVARQILPKFADAGIFPEVSQS